MKLRDWAVEKFGENKVIIAMVLLFNISNPKNVMPRNWLIVEAQPQHYIEAVVRLVLKE